APRPRAEPLGAVGRRRGQSRRSVGPVPPARSHGSPGGARGTTRAEAPRRGRPPPRSIASVRRTRPRRALERLARVLQRTELREVAWEQQRDRPVGGALDLVAARERRAA